ncbi:hypothetical protein [Candidatus Stoquefichus massiliensis]|uniref:hypothetical protein n=1 Tax=Candidatus Stoquefichus massiliensis TaxID=1470350 RepID=UPI00047F5D00|nr:hypothetical protein [Candidatus Stoquefichus massiliensis]
MPINTLATATLFQQTLDLVAQQEALTGWMEANAGQVKYSGGAEVKIPKIALQGLGQYDREKGYNQGAITLEYETRTMTQDRGRKFSLDAMDVDETNFVATASTVMGEFQRMFVTPEIDAYRLSKLITTAITKDENIVYGYVPAESTILREIKKGIAKIRDKGYNGELVIHMTADAKLELEMALAGKITDVTFSQGGIDTKVPAVDQCPIIETPQNRMYSAITIYDGETSGQEQGGYVKGTGALEANFIIVPRITPIAISKQDVMRIFDPLTNQRANAWDMDYRRFHEIWTLDNKEDSIYVNIKDSKPTA